MDNGRKNLKDLVLKVIVLFIGFEIFWKYLGVLFAGELWKSMLYGKYGIYFFVEGVIFVFALVLLFLTGKLNILKRKRLKVKDALKLGIPIVVLSMLVLIANIVTLDFGSLNIHNLISLILYSGAIGLFEEILFRGVILGELLDGYGNTRKQVVISIIISSIIFSLTHITNLLAGQDMLTTMMQVVQTFALGFLLGSMYYISGNIWSVIFLHGFYDFSILIGDVNLIKDCTMASSVPIGITISSLITSLILSAIYILYSFTVLNRKRVKEVLKEEVEESDIEYDKKVGSKLINGVWFLVGGFFIFNVLSGMVLNDNSSNYSICYEYERISLNNVETHYYNYDDYTITALNDLGEPINYRLYLKDSKVYLNDTDLGIVNVQRVVSFDNKILVIVVDNANYKLYYSDFTKLDLDNISNSFEVFTVPDVAGIGYLVSDNEKYPMIKSTISDIFIIKDNKVMLVEKK